MSSPGSLSPSHPKFQARLAVLRTAGRWHNYSLVSKPKAYGGQTLVTLFATTSMGSSPGEVAYQADRMQKALSLMKRQGGFVSGNTSIRGDGTGMVMTSAVVLDPIDIPQIEKANFFGYTPRKR